MSEYNKYFFLSGAVAFGVALVADNYPHFSGVIAGFWIGFWGGVAFKNVYKNRLKNE